MDCADDPFADFGAYPTETPSFETLGIVPAAFTALTFALAATAGIVLRNTVMALAASIIVAGLLIAALSLIRAHLFIRLSLDLGRARWARHTHRRLDFSMVFAVPSHGSQPAVG